jgi:hypothetical protein
MTDLYSQTATLYIRVYEPRPPPGDERVVWRRRVLPRTLFKNAAQKRLVIPVRGGGECAYRPPTWEEGFGFYALPDDERERFWTISAGVVPDGGDLVFNGIGPEIGDDFRETALLTRYPDRAWKARSVRDNSTANERVAHVLVTD